jgi:hypothetical protein
MVRLGSWLSSNRSLECKPFFVPRLWFAGSSVVFAVDISRRMMGLRRRNLPRCKTHASGLWACRCINQGGMVRPRPGRDASARLRTGASEFCLDQAIALPARVNGSPDLSIACMMTASFLATATAARLNPIRSRNCNPHRRRSLSAWVRVRITVAAS